MFDKTPGSRRAGALAPALAECRLWALAAWAFPDLWRACGGHRVAQPVLRRWPHLSALSRAHLDTIAAFGRLDLDALAWELSELIDDIGVADAAVGRATEHALVLWHTAWPGDVLCSIPGIGPVCAATTRAWWGTGTQLSSAKAAAAFVGLNPSNWESGLSASPSRKITRQGPAELRLAFYQAANVARRHDPALAEFYRRLMVERRHNHISANTALARKLVCRAWAVLHTGEPYELRDLDGKPIDWAEATTIATGLAVPDDVRRRSRAHLQRGRMSI